MLLSLREFANIKNPQCCARVVFALLHLLLQTGFSICVVRI